MKRALVFFYLRWEKNVQRNEVTCQGPHPQWHREVREGPSSAACALGIENHRHCRAPEPKLFQHTRYHYCPTSYIRFILKNKKLVPSSSPVLDCFFCE